MCSTLDFSIGKIEHFLVGKLSTLYNLAKNVVVFGTKRRTFWNIYSKNLEHLLTIYTKGYEDSHLTVLFFRSARSVI